MNQKDKLHELDRGASAQICHAATGRAENLKLCPPFFSEHLYEPKRISQSESLLSKATVMERLGVSDRTLRRLVKQGRLRAVKLGKTSPLKFRQLDVARLLESSIVSGS